MRNDDLNTLGLKSQESSTSMGFMTNSLFIYKSNMQRNTENSLIICNSVKSPMTGKKNHGQMQNVDDEPQSQTNKRFTLTSDKKITGKRRDVNAVTPQHLNKMVQNFSNLASNLSDYEDDYNYDQ